MSKAERNEESCQGVVDSRVPVLPTLFSRNWDHSIWDLESALLLKLILHDLEYFTSISGEYYLEKRFHFSVVNQATL